MSGPINSQIQNLRLRIEILKDRKEIESSTMWELSKRTSFSDMALHYDYERISIEKVMQIGSRIERLEKELEELLTEI